MCIPRPTPSTLSLLLRMITLDLRPHYVVGAHATDPELRVFCAPADAFHLVRHHAAPSRGHASYTLTALRPAAPRGVFGMHVYEQVLNQSRQPCAVHVAYATLDPWKLFGDARAAAPPWRVRLTGRLRGDDFGYVDIHVRWGAGTKAAAAEPPSTPPAWPTASLAGPSQKDLETLAEASLADLAHLRPAYPLLEQVLAPLYHVGPLTVPGAAFFCRREIVLTEACAEHMLAVVLARHGLALAHFAAGHHAPVPAGAILAEWCGALPSSMPYIGELFPSKKRGLVPYESFDNLFRRHAGDCEDFSRAVTALFSAARFRSDHWQRPALRALAHVAKAYVALCMLGTVGHVSGASSAASTAGGGGGYVARTRGTGELAHMHAELWPAARFARVSGLPMPDDTVLTGTHATYTVEATCHTTLHGADPAAATLPVALPAGFEAEDTLRGFYHTNVHAYTDHFVTAAGGTFAGQPVFFSLVNADGTYGVPYDQTPHRVHAHRRFTASEAALVQTVLALAAPPVVLRPPAAAAAPPGTVPPDAAVVYGMTGSTMAHTELRRRLRAADRTVQSAVVEHFAAGFAPQLRMVVVVVEGA